MNYLPKILLTIFLVCIFTVSAHARTVEIQLPNPCYEIQEIVENNVFIHIQDSYCIQIVVSSSVEIPDSYNQVNIYYDDVFEYSISLNPIQPPPPNLSYSIDGFSVTLNWSDVSDATGYMLNYASYPYEGPSTIESVNMGTNTTFSADLWEGAAFYVAMQAYDETQESEYSNIVFFTTTAEESPAEKQKGISYASWWEGQYSEPGSDLALANLADTGANWISLIVTIYQDSISSFDIYATNNTASDDDLIHVINEAHNLGLKVMLKPHLDLNYDPDHWRGQIGLNFTEEKWATWFASYKNFINHYSQLAQTYDVEQFCVGTELHTSERWEAEWREIISDVRNQYSGSLIYTANHGDETSITWWDALDYIGIDAYYPLSNNNNPTLMELKATWQTKISTLEALASTWNKSIIFAEIGYRSLDGSTQHPWDYWVIGTIDLQEQADAYQATFESVFNQPWLGGIYWWYWNTDPFQGGTCDDDYTTYDKPAEDILRLWYGGDSRISQSLPQPDYGQTSSIYTDSLYSGWSDWSWDSNVNLSLNDTVYRGQRAISVNAEAWGGLSLHHENFELTPYYWLEFYLKLASSEQKICVLVHDENDQPQQSQEIDDCRYTDGNPIEPDVWTKVRIPISHLNTPGRLIQRVSFQNCKFEDGQFWVDEIQLIGALGD